MKIMSSIYIFRYFMNMISHIHYYIFIYQFTI